MLGTREGKAIRFNEQNVRSIGRTGRGVKGIELNETDNVIDMIVLGVVLSLFSPIYWRSGASWAVPFMDLGGRSVIHFLYWTIMEGMYGQSLGKMVMKIEVAHEDGGRIDYGRAALQAVGKAFLLPIDVVLGWMLYPRRDQRLFNKISETVVVRKFV